MALASDDAVSPSNGKTDAPADSSVVATMNGQPISARKVQEFWQPRPYRVGAAPSPDPRQEALDRALRVRLFANEASRRGVVAPQGTEAFARAFLNQALIRAEMKRLGLSDAVIDEKEARAYFDAHRSQMLKFYSAALQVIVVADAPTAERLLRKSIGVSTKAFGQMARQYSVDEASRQKDGAIGTFDLKDYKHDILARFGHEVMGLSTALRTAGEVGMAQGDDGRWVLMRADQVVLEPLTWNDNLAQRAKSALVRERSEYVLADLERRLRAAANIKIDHDALSKIGNGRPSVTTAADREPTLCDSQAGSHHPR